MSTAEEGGAPSSNVASPYGGGGAGGKFRKKPFRRQPTPYDRPPTTSRGTNNSSDTSSWMTKLFVEPASKLIAYGANRFFESVFRKRLPQPPPPQAPDKDDGANDEAQVAILNNQESVEERAGGESSAPTNSRSNGVHELEQLLKQKTFSRLEITHLTNLLQSRAVEVSPGDDGKKTEATVLNADRQDQFASGSLEDNRNERIRTSADMSTHALNSNALEDDVATPAELAKTYMGSRPSKGSKSVLGIRHQGGVEDVGFLGNMPFTPKMPITSLTSKTSVSVAAPENGFITPRTRGRSAIYSMARAPNSRVHLISNFKGSRSNNTGNTGPSMPSSAFSLAENEEKFKSLPMTLKRRNSVLDDDVGYAASIRRTRQKSNLLASKTVETIHRGSHAKQNLQLIGEPVHKVFQGVGETLSESAPGASRSRIPSKSTEVAARIFQHLEKLTPKEKSSDSKFVAARDRSPVKLVSGVLSGHAPRSMEDMDSSKLLMGNPHDHNSGDNSVATLSHTRDLSSQKPQNNEESGTKEFVAPSGTFTPLVNHDSTASVSVSVTAIKTANFLVENGAPHIPKKRAFRMSAEEDFLELDDDLLSNGLGRTVSSEKMGTVEVPLTGSKPAPAEVPKLVKTTLASEASVVSQSAVIPFSVATSEKSLISTSSPVFNFSSKAGDKFPTLPSESNKKTDSTVENPSSLLNVSASSGSQLKFSELNKSGHSSPLKADNVNGIFDTTTCSKGAHISISSLGSTSAASDDINQTSTGNRLVFASTSRFTNLVPTSIGASATSASSGSIFGLPSKPSNSSESFKFGALADPATGVTATSDFNKSVLAEVKGKVHTDPSSGSESIPNSRVIASPSAANPNKTVSGFGPSVSHSTPNIQGSLFGSTLKSEASGTGTLSQGSSLTLPPTLPETVSQAASVSSTSPSPSPSPLFSMNGNASGSLFSNPQILNPNNSLGYSSSATLSGTATVAPTSGPTSSVLKFGASPVLEGNAVTSSSTSTSGIFSFGFSSSSSSSSAGSNSSATLPKFNFGGNNPSASVGSSTAGSSGIFNFGGNSCSSSTVSIASTNTAAPNIFSSSWPSTASSIFSSSSTSPSTGFSFGASSASAAATNTAPMSFNSTSGPSSSSFFSFTVASAPVSSSSSLPTNQPVFGNPFGGSASGNNDQMNAEDSMAEDPVQSSAASVPVFGQPSVSPSPPSFAFGSTAPSQPNAFMFCGQQSQVTPQSPSPFQASGSLGGSFSLGSGGGGYKSGRRIVKVNRNKNKKKV